VFFNKRYFCKLFKKYTGKTYKQYLREVKLNYALNLLKRTNLKITVVAIESGYSTVSHFNREFYAYYKKTPTQEKKQSGNL
jgi:AraC-like DNA-binding protein